MARFLRHCASRGARRASGMMQPCLQAHTYKPMKPTDTTPSLPPRWLAYGLLGLSMALVGSYVALSKPLAAALPVFLLAWMRFGIGALAMPHWLINDERSAKFAADAAGKYLFERVPHGRYEFRVSAPGYLTY